ncbi:uncharacterized protein JCM6883_005276 [Sporobolomyces salmoneus]|uniref:uncharacterized protein n=1 Tax=Sporobolomyces salmoneus TaxID=183962 RepID=UPI00316D7FCC
MCRSSLLVVKWRRRKKEIQRVRLRALPKTVTLSRNRSALLSASNLRQFHLSPRSLSSPSSSSSSSAPAIFQANSTDVYPFGVPSNDPSRAWFLSLNWTISSSSSWAILSSSSPSSSSSSTTTNSRSNLVSTILHQVRYDPIGSASHPILKTLPLVERIDAEPRERGVEDLIQFVSFKTRLGGNRGEFGDYTSRYYSIREEDQLTTREHLKQTAEGEVEDQEVVALAKLLKMEELLELPLITLSNGQTRRARILRALLKKPKPELLILEEPFSGLDVASRQLLINLLESLHAQRSPRILLVLRPQDPLPHFVTHLALVQDSTSSEGVPASVQFGTKAEMLETEEAKELFRKGEEERIALRERKERNELERRNSKSSGREPEREGKKLIELKGVNVTYGREVERPVLRDVDWTIREGEKWVLAGHNGSGKSTLLSILLGDHPRSFTEDVTLFDKPRYRQATSTIQQNIGHVSPEIFNAFPRKYGEQGLTAYDAIVTGFESIFSYRSPTPSQRSQISSVLTSFSHPLLTPSFLSRLFASLTPGEQSLILLLRALVKRPALLVLDEPFQGMDELTIEKTKRWLEGLGREQSVVLISHFEEEIPRGFGRRLELENGRIKELI